MEEMKYSDTPVSAFVSECIADIYQDIRDLVSDLQFELTEQMNDALYRCMEHFHTYWGQRLVNVLRPLHAINSRQCRYLMRMFLTRRAVDLTITKEQIAEMTIEAFEGDIHVIDQREQVAKAVSYLSTYHTLGFDTETKPAFKRGQVNKVALMQLATEKECYLFRLNRIGYPKELEASWPIPKYGTWFVVAGRLCRSS